MLIFLLSQFLSDGHICAFSLTPSSCLNEVCLPPTWDSWELDSRLTHPDLLTSDFFSAFYSFLPCHCLSSVQAHSPALFHRPLQLVNLQLKCDNLFGG